MSNSVQSMGTVVAPVGRTRLWTPDQGATGLIIIARPQPLLAVIGGRLAVVGESAENRERFGERRQRISMEGLIIVSNLRQKEPTRVIGHPDLASGASVQRGVALYVSVAEAIYRETRGEEVEIHLMPTEEDAEALGDLRVRARHRWDNDRLPDGWTRPLPPLVAADDKKPQEKSLDAYPEDLRALAERFAVKKEDAL